jgi:hypothetical protein
MVELSAPYPERTTILAADDTTITGISFKSFTSVSTLEDALFTFDRPQQISKEIPNAFITSGFTSDNIPVISDDQTWGWNIMIEFGDMIPGVWTSPGTI